MLFVVCSQVTKEYTGLSADSLNLVAVRRHFSDCAPAMLLHYLLCHRLWHVGVLLKFGNISVVRELGPLGIIRSVTRASFNVDTLQYTG
jgi:hypothetical protein